MKHYHSDNESEWAIVSGLCECAARLHAYTPTREEPRAKKTLAKKGASRKRKGKTVQKNYRDWQAQ